MNFLKKLVPNSIKRNGKYFLYDILKIPYTRSGVPIEIVEWLPPNKAINFIDIGAHYGHFTLNLSKEYEIKKGILIEPQINVVPILKKEFIDTNTYKILNVAVSDSNAETEFYINSEFDSVSSLLEIYNESSELESLKLKKPSLTKIQTQTLDYIVDQQQLSDIDLIKIDVQGAEHLVLKSAIETLKKTKIVYTEFSFKPLYKNSSTFFDLYKIFYENNFFLANISQGYSSPNRELLQGDALFVNKNYNIGRS